MPASITIAPVNSLIFLHGSRDWRAPEINPELSRVWSTASCVAIACYPEIDGATNIIIGEAEEVVASRQFSFDGILETPEKRISITTVDSEKPVLEFAVATPITRIRVSANHPLWPDVVRIGLG